VPYPKKREITTRSRLYRKYKYQVFPRVDHIRGATKLLDILEKVAQLGMNKIGEHEIEPVYEKSWDNLLILDAARHDTYQKTINSEAESRITVESYSKGFIRETFSVGDWSDTIVITANPFYNEKDFTELVGESPDDIFEVIFQVWDTDWEKNPGTVMPQKMVEKAKTAEKLFPEKRKIIHFMQPHYPFLNSQIEDQGYGDAFQDYNNDQIWTRVEKKELKQEDVKKDYINNHSILEEHLESLNNIITGKTVITADHGNLLGENGFYGHPRESNLRPVRKVPWDDLDNIRNND
jgi:hypothetical protein